MTVNAPEATQRHLKVTTLDPYRFTIKQSVSHFLPSRRQHTGKSSPGDIHPLSTFLLFQLLNVLKANRLCLLNRKTYFLQLSQGYASGFEVGNLWHEIYSAT